MSTEQHPLAIETNVVQKEFNVSKFVGQVALGISVSLAVRYLIAKFDKFTAKKTK